MLTALSDFLVNAAFPCLYSACGVCHTDVHVMRGDVAFPFPCVLGHEISGVVAEHGPGTDAATQSR